MSSSFLTGVGSWRKLLRYRRPAIVLAHVGLFVLSFLFAFLLRFDFALPQDQRRVFLEALPLLVSIRGVLFGWFHLYEGMWRYVGTSDALAIIKGVTLSSLVFTISELMLFGHGFPRSVIVQDWLLCMVLVAGVRLASRLFREATQQRGWLGGRRAVVVGAGDAGELLVREIEKNYPLNYEVVGFVDDAPGKQGRRIHGIEVIGPIATLPELSKSLAIEEVLIAVPSATPEQRQRMIDCCVGSGVSFKSVPTLTELLEGRARIAELKEVEHAELLGRAPIRVDLNRIRGELQGKRILVTGAAGSIGSELCRQVAKFDPETLVLFDRAESNLYVTSEDLHTTHPGLKMAPAVGDLLDERRVEEVLETYRPHLVYHAAAYKHVPLMEDHPIEAIRNNVFGTEILAEAASRAGVLKFVFISTDKAVKPVGIMGMTKRVAEALLLSYAGSQPRFTAVRFGNVLGSDGSILPLLQRQIARGGPVTVTHREATRYFMLLSEAVQLVLQAGTLGRGHDVFFLDMGEPVRILDFAMNVMRLSGVEPAHVGVKLTGLRGGERLKEHLVRDQEELSASEHEKIFVVRYCDFNAGDFRQDLEVLRRVVAARDRDGATVELGRMAGRY